MDAERGGHTRAIAVTAFSTQRDQQLAESSGFEGYITNLLILECLLKRSCSSFNEMTLVIMQRLGAAFEGAL